MKSILLSLLIPTALVFAATSKQDDKTSLIWQDNQDITLQQEMTYDEAIQYCKTLKVDGFDDWRLPTIRELYTIVDLNRDRPALKNGFEIQIQEKFWTATPYAKDPKKEAWRISFGYGEIEPYPKTREYHARCVRGKMTP